MVCAFGLSMVLLDLIAAKSGYIYSVRYGIVAHCESEKKSEIDVSVWKTLPMSVTRSIRTDMSYFKIRATLLGKNSFGGNFGKRETKNTGTWNDS